MAVVRVSFQVHELALTDIGELTFCLSDSVTRHVRLTMA
jgi:hypothetical protein